MAICSINECGKKVLARGWCGVHYERWRAHGDPSVMKKIPNGGYMAFGYKGHQINGVRKFDHVRIAEKALGRPLPKDAIVHHANENKLDNRNDNLVICPDRKYHKFLHMRIDAMRACGNPNWLKCPYCKQHDNPLAMRIYTIKGGSPRGYHAVCRSAYRKPRMVDQS